jgi:hypothetical protein
MAQERIQWLRSTPVPLPSSWRMATTLPLGNTLGDFLRSDTAHMTFDGGFAGIVAARRSLDAYRCVEYSPSEVRITADGIRSGAHLVFQKTGHARAKVVATYEAARQEGHTLGSAMDSFQCAYDAMCREQQSAREEAAMSGVPPDGAAAAWQPAQAAAGLLQKRCSNTPENTPDAKRTKPVARVLFY